MRWLVILTGNPSFPGWVSVSGLKVGVMTRCPECYRQNYLLSRIFNVNGKYFLCLTTLVLTKYLGQFECKHYCNFCLGRCSFVFGLGLRDTPFGGRIVIVVF